MKQGIFYAVGVGAGDPMDMTLRAKAVLEQADIIVTPIPKAGGTSAAYAIAAQAADLSHAERLDILFPMQAHRQVAMVTLGDVSVYSTASYVRQLLAEKGYATQVIAGVPSFCAGAAKAQQSLCENSESLQILPAVHSREAVETALEQFDNLVVMKAGRAMAWLLPLLRERGLLEHTTMLRDVGMPSEYIGKPELEPYSYFTTLLIKGGDL